MCETMSYASALAIVGLEYVTTGRGRSALELRHRDTAYTHVLDSRYEDQAPLTLDAPATVCFYDEGEDTPKVAHFATLLAAIGDIYGAIAPTRDNL
jgi:hypothetical protein